MGLADAPNEESLRLWLMDSGGNNKEFMYDAVSPEIVESFGQLSGANSVLEASRKDSDVPASGPRGEQSDSVQTEADTSRADFELQQETGTSLGPKCAADLVFFHIPLPEMGYCQPVCGTEGLFDAAVRVGMAPWWAGFASPLIKVLIVVLSITATAGDGMHQACVRHMGCV